MPEPVLERILKSTSRAGDLVLDPFVGSGSTIIACEQMGRRCVAVELDPHYADVTIERWEQFTGKTAELVGKVE